jgi:AbrB family looped-hinge helix DNA binding protein
MKDSKKETCCSNKDKSSCCCTVTGVVTVDERGQIVLPKDLRDKAQIKAGDKLAIVAMGDPKESCLMLMKVNELDNMVKIKIDAVLGKSNKEV